MTTTPSPTSFCAAFPCADLTVAGLGEAIHRIDDICTTQQPLGRCQLVEEGPFLNEQRCTYLTVEDTMSRSCGSPCANIDDMCTCDLPICLCRYAFDAWYLNEFALYTDCDNQVTTTTQSPTSSPTPTPVSCSGACPATGEQYCNEYNTLSGVCIHGPVGEHKCVTAAGDFDVDLPVHRRRDVHNDDRRFTLRVHNSKPERY